MNREVVISVSASSVISFGNWYDTSVSINSISIDKIDSPNSKIDNLSITQAEHFYRFLSNFKKINRYLLIVIERYRLSMLSIDYARLRLMFP